MDIREINVLGSRIEVPARVNNLSDPGILRVRTERELVSLFLKKSDLFLLLSMLSYHQKCGMFDHLVISCLKEFILSILVIQQKLCEEKLLKISGKVLRRFSHINKMLARNNETKQLRYVPSYGDYVKRGPRKWHCNVC